VGSVQGKKGNTAIKLCAYIQATLHSWTFFGLLRFLETFLWERSLCLSLCGPGSRCIPRCGKLSCSFVLLISFL